MWPKRKSIKDLLPPPVKVAHGEYSMILSAHDDQGRPNPFLIDLSARAISAAGRTDLSNISRRLTAAPYFPDIWPGEHYKLLAGFVQTLQPKLVIEIGTSTGLSALAMGDYLPQGAKLITYDIQPWDSYPNTVLRPSDFASGALQQVIGNLGDPLFFASQKALLQKADLIFIDATHDGSLEKTLLDFLSTLLYEKPPVLLFDDIRVWSMLKMWREIALPKLDLTSFGHWSGTGLVQLT